jgi:Flp pilus assembly CpaF family ATPase
MVTDVIISAYNDIRCRIHGKSYLSNLTFVDTDDYKRFVWGICLKTRQKMNSEDITFTYSSDDNYILRMELSPEYINSADWPYLHIRKVSRKKLLADDLIKAGMFDKKIRDYLIDRGRHGKGVVFAGPPGCGKTVILNWFLEDAYEQTADIYCIQENDELFAYRKGVRFQHVVNVPTKEHGTVSLEDLGKHALVAGANVFIIGETKGAEICSAITLSNSGCRTATTLHSQSSTETIEKMCDLAMKGYVQDYVQAKRSLKAFDTIVYLANFKVQEISEIVTFDETKKDMVYRSIYRRNKEKIAK